MVVRSWRDVEGEDAQTQGESFNGHGLDSLCRFSFSRLSDIQSGSPASRAHLGLRWWIKPRRTTPPREEPPARRRLKDSSRDLADFLPFAPCSDVRGVHAPNQPYPDLTDGRPLRENLPWFEAG